MSKKPEKPVTWMTHYSNDVVQHIAKGGEGINPKGQRIARIELERRGLILDEQLALT